MYSISRGDEEAGIVAGFLMIVFRRFRWMYLSKLNAFVMRQLCCGINSSSISMGIICLMLFATIVSFVTGISVANQFQTGVREKTPAALGFQ